MNLSVPQAGIGLQPGTDVKVRGVRVRQVVTVDLHDDGRPTVILRLEPGIQVPTNDLTVIVTPKTFFGEKQIELIYPLEAFGQPAFLQDGDTLVSERAVTEVEDVLVTLEPLLTGIDADDLATLFEALAALEGEGDRIAESLEVGAELARFGTEITDDVFRNARLLTSHPRARGCLWFAVDPPSPMNAKAPPMTNAEPAAPDAARAPARPRAWPVVLPWALAVLAIAAATFSTVQWRSLADQQAQVDQARAAAVGFVTDLTNWDAAQGLDPVLTSLREQGTGPFLNEIDDVFFGGDLGQELEAGQVAASGQIREAFVQSVANDRASVFVVVDVTCSSPQQREALPSVTFPAEVVAADEARGDRALAASGADTDEVRVAIGRDITATLVDAAGDYDLLVLGNTGMSWPSRLLGSVAISVTHHLPTDLLLVNTSR